MAAFNISLPVPDDECPRPSSSKKSFKKRLKTTDGAAVDISSSAAAKSNPNAVHCGDNVRFTVLAARIIRAEHRYKLHKDPCCKVLK